MEGDPMQIRLLIQGGFAYFPGLSAPYVVDTTDLSAAEAERLRRLIRRVGFFDLPERIGFKECAVDCQRYLITVRDARRQHTVEAVEPLDDPGLFALVEGILRAARVGV